MKGCLKNFLKFIALFSFFSFLEACDFPTLFNPDYNEGVKGYFEEYTETAAIMLQELDGKYPSDSQGITCFPSGDSRIVKLYLRNPQNYILNVSMESDDVVNNNVTVVQDETDKSIVTVTYPGSWLLEKDKDDKDISGVIKIVEPVSGRQFQDWNITLHADSVPPAIKSPVFQLDSSDLSAAHYIVCFYFPNLSTIGNGVHSDVNTLLIDGKKYYISGTSIYNDEGCTKLNESFVSEKPAGLTADSQNNPGYDFDPAAVPEDYIVLYYLTGASPSTDEVSYSFVLQDKAGLKSSEVSISNKAKKLSSPVICRTDGTELSSGESLAADEDTFLYTLLINHDGTDEDGASCGTAVINYTITETNGALVFADGTSSVLTAVSEGSVSVKLPKGTYTVTAEASKNFYLTSDEVSVSGIKIRKPAVYYISESGFDSDSQSGSAGEPYRTVQYALNQYAAGVTSGEYELDDGCDIRVLTDLTVPADFDWTANGNYFVNTSVLTNAVVNISGWQGTKTVDISQEEDSTHTIFNAASGKVNISNLNFTGGYTDSDVSPIFNISSGVEFVIKDSKIYENTLASDNGRLSLIQSAGTLEMNNVIVSDNSQIVGAGADPMNTPAFYAINQTAGQVTLNDCSITSSGTGHGAYWILICVSSGTFTMNGGSIRDNTGCNIVLSNDANGTTLNDVVIDNNGDEWGDIISNTGKLFLTGCTVTGNTGGYNGLITNYSGGTLNLTDTEIKNNNLVENVYAGAGDDYYNCGGAVWNNGSLTLDGCTISGNTINNVNGRGAGIYMKTGADLSLTLKGKNYIYDNYNNAFTPPKRDDIYLPTGCVITVDGDISGSTIGVNVPWESSDAGAPRIGSPAEFTSGYGTGNTVLPGEIFITENNYSITASSSGEAAFAVSGGGMYTALDYDVNLTASSVSVYPDTEKTISIAVGGTRKEPGGTPTDLYYNNADGKFYTDPDLTAKAAGDNTVTFAAALYNGGVKVSDCEIGHPELDSGSILVTVPALAYEDTYTLRITSTFFGVTKDTSVEYAVKKLVSVASLSEAPTSGVYSLSTLSELEKIRDWVSSNNTLQNVTFTLEDDIDTNGEELIIGYYKSNDSANRAFMGVFDGNNHTITNKITASDVNTSARIALFSYVKGSSTVIKNLTVKGTSTRGSIVGYLNENASVENCISETVINASVSEIGGIVCYMNTGYVRNCINKGNITSSKSAVAGIVGEAMSGNGAIDRCINKGNISGYTSTGGIAGYLQGQTPVTNCKNYGNIPSNSYSGGIIGLYNHSSSKLNNNCNLGEITYGGGIFYYSDTSKPNFNNNCNSNTIKYGACAKFDSGLTSIAANNNYSLNVYTTALYPSTASGSFNPSTITESQIKSFELSEAGSVVESLNNWATANSTTSLTYASWKLNAEGKPELDLGEMDNW
ncbi:hypothetical protein HNP77_002349 [Treponema rectale]|uniref:Polymorphic outer membrane protein repeat-containing protein n=1 Tax=Treponema rectale TaxID=744512 RepID=A0A840SGU3_9SPIR|nr:hypothetical protein [Treponema rectale]MBB5219960.1 hypothetical protein [Treponema rectale]